MKITQELLERDWYNGHNYLICPYLHDRLASLLFLEGSQVSPDIYRALLDSGYRRSGLNLYRPDCHPCLECQVIRIDLDEFQSTDSQKRIWKKGNGVFTVQTLAPAYSRQRLRLYQKYLLSQHGSTESDMDERSYSFYFVDTFLGDATKELNFFVQDKLAGVGIVDLVQDAFSSVYFYFNPEFAKFSPGVYSMLFEIEMAKSLGFRYYYPGYYVKGCRQMNYKVRFGPSQIKRIDDREFRPVQK